MIHVRTLLLQQTAEKIFDGAKVEIGEDDIDYDTIDIIVSDPYGMLTLGEVQRFATCVSNRPQETLLQGGMSDKNFKIIFFKRNMKATLVWDGEASEIENE